MSRKVYRVKVFTKNPKFGNLAGVVPDADGLTESKMQKIAMRVGASETAFVFSSKKADFKIRWFTPTNEVGMCVHASIAAIAIMKLLKKVSNGNVLLESKNTLIRAHSKKGKVELKIQGYHTPVLAKATLDICNLLSINQTVLESAPVIVRIYADKELIVPVKSLNVLKHLNPNVKKYSLLCKYLGVTGISIFTREVFNKVNSLHTREFAPLYGYFEDPLCGLAAGAIARYLLKGGTKKILKVEQGHFLNKMGQILVRKSNSAFYIGGNYVIIK